MENILPNKKILLIGLDMSFNSTGITFSVIENNKPQKIKFYRVVFDDESNKTHKLLKPQDIQNVNQVVYRMPTNINVADLSIDNQDKNSYEQIRNTLRAMICSKKINKIIANNINQINPNVIICTMENYIMPAFGGRNSLNNVSGLLLLQGFVREWFIKFAVSYSEINTYLFTPTPKQTKKYFTGNGSADKKEMQYYFVENFDGQKLLPNMSKGKLDDIIDSFALMVHGYNKYLNLVKC